MPKFMDLKVFLEFKLKHPPVNQFLHEEHILFQRSVYEKLFDEQTLASHIRKAMMENFSDLEIHGREYKIRRGIYGATNGLKKVYLRLYTRNPEDIKDLIPDLKTEGWILVQATKKTRNLDTDEIVTGDMLDSYRQIYGFTD